MVIALLIKSQIMKYCSGIAIQNFRVVAVFVGYAGYLTVEVGGEQRCLTWRIYFMGQFAIVDTSSSKSQPSAVQSVGGGWSR
jgi:hypothetical protein